jgi:hypothetical protein
VKLGHLAQGISSLFHDRAVQPLKHFYFGLNAGDRSVFYALVVTAVLLGFVLGRRRSFGAWGSTFQNKGEALVSRFVGSRFGPPDYHLMNHVTIQMDDGTTQVDHILVSRFGVFVIETKDYGGWIFAKATDATWTQVYFRQKFKFQNPIFQNYRHVRAIQALLDFLPPEAVKSVVVFTGKAEFKTEIPKGVVAIDQLADHVDQQTEVVMSLNRLQFCVGRLETARLTISGQTDVEHVQDLARRLGSPVEQPRRRSRRRL